VFINCSDVPALDVNPNSDGASQWDFFNPVFNNQGSGWVGRLNCEQIKIFGGTVTERGGGDGLNLFPRGGVWGTNFEGEQNGDTTACALSGDGSWEFRPTTVQKWGTGLSIGDPDDETKSADDVRFRFEPAANANQDVLVRKDGIRRNWTPLPMAFDYSITNNRTNDEKNPQPWNR
jgi:hypothetical protein